MYQRLLKETLDTQIPFRALVKYTRIIMELALNIENITDSSEYLTQSVSWRAEMTHDVEMTGHTIPISTSLSPRQSTNIS